MRMWLAGDMKGPTFVNKLATNGEMKIIKVKNEICSKIKRLGNHLQQHVSHVYSIASVHHAILNQKLYSCDAVCLSCT